MIAQGKYRAQATHAEFGESPTKGTPFIRVAFQILDGAHQGDRISWDGWVTDRTRERVVDSLRSCGCTFPGDDITDLTGLGTQEVEIVVEIENYNGRDRAKVAWVNSLVGAVKNEQRMDDGKRAAFRDSMRGALFVSRTKAGAQQSLPGTAPAPAPGSSPADDIPF